jgi:mRNA-degrading endonuclease RelE of RelBE toxin-antitoxin system
MPLELRWDLRVPEGLCSLPEVERRRVVNTMLSLVEHPEPPGSRPLPAKPHWFRLDDGHFRFLYVIDLVDATVTTYAVMKDGELLGPGY